MLDIPRNSPYFFDFFKQDWPSSISCRNLFENDRDLEIEIGCGNGHFLQTLALKNPHINYLGIEISLKRALKTHKKILNNNLKNLKIVFVDAMAFLGYFSQAAEIQKIYINFPDPWPKKRHAKKRLLQAPLLQMVCNKIVPAGKLYIVSDYWHNITAAKSFADNCHLLKRVHTEEYLLHLPDYPPTLYCERYMQEQRPIYHLVYCKTD